MPNFWTKTTQFFDEALHGPRTKDFEFQKKINEIKTIENGLNSLKNLLSNFSSQTNQIKKLFISISQIINNIYINSPEYSTIINDISSAHNEMISFYTAYADKMAGLNAQAANFKEIFKQTNNLIEKREEKRKNFDHYDEKMEKINKKKNKDYEYARRNEEKYMKAKDEFFAISEEAVIAVNNSLSTRYELINPVISEFLSAEKTFMRTISNVLSKFDNIQLTFQQIEMNKKKQQPINQYNYLSNNVPKSNNNPMDFNFDFSKSTYNSNQNIINNFDFSSTNLQNYPKYSHVSSDMFNKKESQNQGCPYPDYNESNKKYDNDLQPSPIQNNKEKIDDHDFYSNYHTYNNYPLRPDDEKDPFKDLI